MYVDLEDVHKRMSKELITPKFLEQVERWARFDGKKTLSVGDTEITNMGTFERKEQRTVFEKNMTAKQYLSAAFSEDSKKEIVGEFYDVTMIHDGRSCSDIDTYVLIAKKHTKEDKGFGVDYASMYPCDLYIFGIVRDKKEETSQTPTFETLKKNFEKKSYTNYHSLIEKKHLDNYSLYSFNLKTDRLRNYSLVENNFRNFDFDDDAKKATKHIKVPKRYYQEELEKKKDEYHDKIMKEAMMSKVKALQEKRDKEGLTKKEEEDFCLFNSKLTGLSEKVFTKEFGDKLDNAIAKTDEFLKKHKGVKKAKGKK